jgi:hypothetical protein
VVGGRRGLCTGRRGITLCTCRRGITSCACRCDLCIGRCGIISRRWGLFGHMWGLHNPLPRRAYDTDMEEKSKMDIRIHMHQIQRSFKSSHNLQYFKTSYR